MITCGFCGEPLPERFEDLYIVTTPTGNVMASMERPVHRCPSISRADELIALRSIGSASR